MLPLAYLLFMVLFMAFLFVGQPYKRYDDSGVYKAWHIRGPGFVYWVEYEIKEPLKNWVGSKMTGLAVVDKQSGKNIPELEAACALRALGLFTDTEMVQIDGEWYLYKPQKTHRQWSWYGSFHRIGPWQIDNRCNQSMPVNGPLTAENFHPSF